MGLWIRAMAAALLVLGLLSTPALAQDDVTATPTAPVSEEDEGPRIHVVQSGETLTSIATQYETTVEALQQLNGITDPALIRAGQILLIPGGEGEAVLAVHTVRLGDTLRGLAAAYQTDLLAIAQSNRLVNPHALPAGVPLTIVSQTGSGSPAPLTGATHVVAEGDGWLSLAAQYDVTPAAIAELNDLEYPGYLFQGQRLRLPGEAPFQFLPSPWQLTRMTPETATQGETVAVYVEGTEHVLPGGRFAGQELRFTPFEDGYVALAALDAFLEPGRQLLEITGDGDRPWPVFAQQIEVMPGGYGTQFITIPEELAHLLAPQVRAQEDAFLETIFSQFSEGAKWEGLFQFPVADPVITAAYGDARSYNGGPLEIYHTGVDFAGALGTPIHAPAAGTVVFSDTLALRGNTLIVDHGLGVMTGYYHLSKIHVAVGTAVAAGQLMADGGSTGLSSGPHLHWDLRIQNVPVNPLQWTREPFPWPKPAPS